MGGEGTLDEIINGFAADFGRCRLGIVPAGTGNDTARSLGIPLDMEKAMEVSYTVLPACLEIVG